jgi:hypothetical protein
MGDIVGLPSAMKLWRETAWEATRRIRTPRENDPAPDSVSMAMADGGCTGGRSVSSLEWPAIIFTCIAFDERVDIQELTNRLRFLEEEEVRPAWLVSCSFFC